MKKVKEFLKALAVWILGIGAAILAIILLFRYGEKIIGKIGKVVGDIRGDMFIETEKSDEIIVYCDGKERLVKLPEPIKYKDVDVVQYLPTGEVTIQVKNNVINRRFP